MAKATKKKVTKKVAPKKKVTVPGPVVVRATDLEAWLRTITAIRLAQAVRLGIETADDVQALEELDEDEPRAVLYGMYEWLGHFLESLIDKAQ